MDAAKTQAFYDHLAGDYHLLFPDWEASMTRQGGALAALIRRCQPDADAVDVLDCSCGIGTQAVGLARQAGLRVVGCDLSPVAAGRARAEAAARGRTLPVAAADMRALPFADAAFDVVLSADNSVAHLLADADLTAALAEMRRVLRPGGTLVLTLREYAEVRATRPELTPPQLSHTPDGRTVTFQLWRWHDDSDCYDLEHLQVIPTPQAGQGYELRVRRVTSRALLREELTGFATAAGFTGVTWHAGDDVGFYQPVLTAQAPAGAG